MPRPRWSRRRGPVITVPFSDEEDAKVVEITEIDLSSAFWSSALPNRTFSEIVERRLQLKEQGKWPKK